MDILIYEIIKGDDISPRGAEGRGLLAGVRTWLGARGLGLGDAGGRGGWGAGGLHDEIKNEENQRRRAFIPHSDDLGLASSSAFRSQHVGSVPPSGHHPEHFLAGGVRTFVRWKTGFHASRKLFLSSFLYIPILTRTQSHHVRQCPGIFEETETSNSFVHPRTGIPEQLHVVYRFRVMHGILGRRYAFIRPCIVSIDYPRGTI